MCRVDLVSPHQVLFNGAPLPGRSLSAEALEEAVLQELMRALHMFTKAVYRQELTDADDLAEWIVSQPNVMPRSAGGKVRSLGGSGQVSERVRPGNYEGQARLL